MLPTYHRASLRPDDISAHADGNRPPRPDVGSIPLSFGRTPAKMPKRPARLGVAITG